MFNLLVKLTYTVNTGYYLFKGSFLMPSVISFDRVRFILNRFRERLWVRPLVVCILSIAAAFLAKLADGSSLAEVFPPIVPESIEDLLSIMAASMLVIATFSVASMVSAYASAAVATTPRSFALVVADDVSQNAFSTFVGAFIFSIVALTAFNNDYFGSAGLFILFIQTVCVFIVVIFTFVRWVDRIARLGRLGSTIEKVELATTGAFKRRNYSPHLKGVPENLSLPRGKAVFAEKVGYVQHIDVEALNLWAEKNNVRVVVGALPGIFATPNRALAYVSSLQGEEVDIDFQCVIKAFQIGVERLFDDDPRFGLVVLSEIATRALSPAVNDPGTAISIIGTLIRLFTIWNKPIKIKNKDIEVYKRVEVPEILIEDMFDDAFTAIARDGAGIVEVSIRLQKALNALAFCGDEKMKKAATLHAKLALKRAKKALVIDDDLIAVVKVSELVQE